MTNKTLGWWAVGTMAALFVFYAGGMADTNEGLWGLFCIVWVVSQVWAGIRLIKTPEPKPENE